MLECLECVICPKNSPKAQNVYFIAYQLCRLVGERRHADHELVEADAEAPPVHRVGVRIVEEQLGRQVVGGPQNPAS